MKHEIAGSMGETEINPSVARHHKILILTLGTISPAVTGRAQSYSDTLTGLRELGFDPTYIFVAVGLGALLILFYIFAIIFRKMQKGKQPDVMAGLTYLDVTGLGKEGLLTPEEQAKIRQAMSRQIARQQQATTRTTTTLPGELSLLADPEVQRLEALAKAKQRGEATPPSSPPFPGTTAVPPTETAHPAKPGQEPPPVENFPEVIDPIPSDWVPPAQTEDVELPSDVLALAEKGLITPEELEKIKARMRARK